MNSDAMRTRAENWIVPLNNERGMDSSMIRITIKPSYRDPSCRFLSAAEVYKQMKCRVE